MQLDWTVFRRGVSYSTTSGFEHRFIIMEATRGYSVADTQTGDLVRLHTLAAAHAWAGTRAGETVVRRSEKMR